jgi:methionyl-tRNA formyltransferase
MAKSRIIFMGTPEFAVATLGSLLMNGFNVVAVVTAPDKPAGRGRKISRSPVKQFAEFSQLPVLQPANLKDQGFINQLKDFNADLFVVVAFRMLPELVWSMPPLGTINLHASLLPHYRGAAPINHALINGETVTGISTFYINETIDTGELLLREEVPVYPYETAGDLHDRLMKKGAGLVIRTITGIENRTLKPIAQASLVRDGEVIREAPRIYPEDCFINWENTPERICNLIRGLSPVPCARTFLKCMDQKLLLKIFEGLAEDLEHEYQAGSIVTDEKTFIKVAATKGFVKITSLQLEGKKRMPVDEFLRGFNISDCTISLT